MFIQAMLNGCWMRMFIRSPLRLFSLSAALHLFVDVVYLKFIFLIISSIRWYLVVHMLVLLQAHNSIKSRVMDSGCDVDRYLRWTNVEPSPLKKRQLFRHTEWCSIDTCWFFWTTLTEVFPCFYNPMKTKCHGKTRKDWVRPALVHVRWLNFTITLNMTNVVSNARKHSRSKLCPLIRPIASWAMVLSLPTSRASTATVNR